MLVFKYGVMSKKREENNKIVHLWFVLALNRTIFYVDYPASDWDLSLVSEPGLWQPTKIALRHLRES